VQCVICTDQGYLHHWAELQQAVQQAYSGPMQLLFAQSAPTELWPQQHPAAAAAANAAGAVNAAAAAAAGAAGSSCCNGSAAEAALAQTSQQQQAPARAPVPTGGLLWQLPSSSSSSSSPQMVWLGPPSSPALTHLQLSHASCPWLLLDPDSQGVSHGLSPGLDRLLKRRYYLVERARAASMVGLLVGTLGAAGYKTALEQLRRLAAEVGALHNTG
jgi:diphthamide biosynthesis protein 2